MYSLAYRTRFFRSVTRFADTQQKMHSGSQIITPTIFRPVMQFQLTHRKATQNQLVTDFRSPAGRDDLTELQNAKLPGSDSHYDTVSQHSAEHTKGQTSAIKNSQDKLPTSDEIIKYSQESKNSLKFKTPTRPAVKRHYDKISRHSAENTKGQVRARPKQ